jgi:hypothetical protein
MVVEMLPMVKSGHLHTWVNCLTKLVVAATAVDVWVLCDQVIVEVVLVTLIPVPCVQCLG